ncbi:8-oxo-dGTP diphosphatase [Evansella caseinilytica]|uniref:8-oxo-dGTP diphosphatase n=1 Tax=Evansella caseinilytica TaxID=1503961 RepID=A0A1H3S9D8_9BACI|nr:8-oxo-dGTP diphosphatase [Evansella caseinilytica]SDZ34723.1 8-oxo-dGTP diphosphatase [Evansella caseinilytica]
MQRVTNCILTVEDKVLMLQKPRRGWWVAPGGKMESGESVRDSVVREFFEETGIQLKDAKLRGIFTIVVEEKGKVIDEWMMLTFQATAYSGELLEQSPEGILAWQPLDAVTDLPMAPGDYHIFHHVLQSAELVYGTFTYTKDFQLIAYRLETDEQPAAKLQQDI